MQRRDAFRMIERHAGADDAAPVAALHQVTVVAQGAAHQPAHHAGGRAWTQCGLRNTGESVSRQRGRDDVKAVASVAPKALRMRQRFDNVEEFGDRTRPAVHQEKR